MTPTHKDAKNYAIAEIGRLMRQYHVNLDDLASLRTEQQTSLVTRILAYVGGTLIVTGLCAYLGMQWAMLDSLLRVILTFGPGMIALIAAVIVERQGRTNGHLITTPLFIVSALFQSSGLFVFLAEYGVGNDGVMGVLMICAVMAMQYFLLFITLRSTMTLMFTLIFVHFAFAALFEKMGIIGRYYSGVLGLSGLLIAGQLMKTRYASITGIGFLFSGFTFTIAMWDIFEKTPYDVVLIGVAGMMIYASVLTQSRMMLFVAIASMLGYLGYYTDRYFSHTVGWPIALIIFGIVLIVASSYAVKLGRSFRPAA